MHTFIIADNISLNLRVLDITAPLPKPGTSDSKRQVLMSAVFSPATNAKTQSHKDAKIMLVRRLALMCCRDLSPFNIIDKSGFRTFLLQSGVVRNMEDIPVADTVSRGGLDYVYDTTLASVKQLIQTSKDMVSMTTDIWTDNYRHRSYITFTLHFCNTDYDLKSVVLKTVHFQDAHTAVNIKREMELTAQEFDLTNKKIIYVTDNGSNIVKACKLLSVDRVGCLAHGIHNLITVDGIKKTAAINAVVGTAKELVKAFVYKGDFLTAEADAILQEQLAKELVAGTEEAEVESIDYGDASELSENSGESVSDSRARQQMTTLKKDCPTRWNSLMITLDSLLKNRELIERCLTRLRKFDMIPSLETWITMEELVTFLRVFQKATALLSGSEYTTSSIALLLRAEIMSALKPCSSDGTVLSELKRNLMGGLNHRFPISEIHVCAAILDPSQRHLQVVQDFLNEREMSGVQFLTNVMDKYGVVEFANSAESAEQCDGNSSEPPWKKAKHELLVKHQAMRSNDREIQQYRCLSMQADQDLLHWWKQQENTFPRLSALAHGILSVPATSAPSERVFSIAGLVLQAKRSNLAPNKVNKVVFVHNNAHLVDDMNSL